MLMENDQTSLGASTVGKKSFFLVEDETLIRMMLADMIEELGHSVVAEAGSLEEAMPLARDGTFDMAILDINLGGADSMPIAEIIAKRGIPFVFATGYAENALPVSFRGQRMLRKPFRLSNWALQSWK